MSNDIVERLRSLRHIHLPQLSDEAAAEIERLRQVVEQKNITDAERWALKYFAAFDRSPRERDAAAAATIRSLLSRTGSDLRQTHDNAPECRPNGEKTPERDR